MRVYSSVDEARGSFAPSVLTIGNFDGVHAGHRALLRQTVAIARQLGVKPSAVTFHPHPTAIVAPERTPKLLTTIEQRCELMAAAGIEQVLVIAFDRSVAAMEPATFFNDVLLSTLGARGIVVGDNFHFGRKQAGTVETLRVLGSATGVGIEIVPAIKRRGLTVSSSEVRRLLREGRVFTAGRLLDRPYALTGDVVRGAGRGAKEVVPTLNLEVPSLDHAERALPREGVYVTCTTDVQDGRTWQSITNAGYRPTFDGKHLTIETFLLQPLEGPAPVRIQIEFMHWLRAEKKFNSPGELKSQIMRDAARAIAWHRRRIRWTGMLQRLSSR